MSKNNSDSSHFTLDPEHFSNLDYLAGETSAQDSSVRSLTPTELTGVAFALQAVANSAMKQSFSNLKLVYDLSGRQNIGAVAQRFLSNPQNIFSGTGSRLLYSAVSTIPAIVMCDYLKEKNMHPMRLALLTALPETALRFPFEISGIRKTFASQGIEVSNSEVLKGGYRAFVPFYLRNCLSWLVIGASAEGDLQKRTAYGFVSGVVGTPFESLGNMVIAESAKSASTQEAYEKALANLKKGDGDLWQNLRRNFFKGALVRGVAGALSANLLSMEFSQFLQKSLRERFGGKKSDVENVAKDVPSADVEGPKVSVISDKEKNGGVGRKS